MLTRRDILGAAIGAPLSGMLPSLAGAQTPPPAAVPPAPPRPSDFVFEAVVKRAEALAGADYQPVP